MPLSRRTFLASSTSLAASTYAAAAPTRPNVLLFICDDLNTDLGCYGTATALTPAVDKLASRGLRFDRAYCQYPLCNPSRSSFLSGRRPETTRVLDQQTVLREKDPSLTFLPDHFRQQGYFVAASGKIFHHAKPNTSAFSAFDLAESKSEGELAANKRRYANPEGERTPDWSAFDGPEADTADAILATHISNWMAQAQREAKPFFLLAGLRKPHLPWGIPKKYFAPPTALPPEASMTGIPKVALITELGPSAPPASRADAIAAYRAATSYMDAQIGKILAHLNQLNLEQNTIVVLIGDNGFHLGDHGLWSKHTLFERATRVPMIFAGPGISKGACSRTVELLDICPSLVELAGLPSPPALEGKSLLPLLRQPKAQWNRPARSVVQRDNAFGRAIRTAHWRYVEWQPANQGPVESELYVHRSDPAEFTNLDALPKHAATLRALRAMLHSPS